MARGTNFVPDFFDPATGIIGDVKNVAELARTKQLESLLKYADAHGLKPVLIVIVSGENKSISGWVKEFFEIIPGP